MWFTLDLIIHLIFLRVLENYFSGEMNVPEETKDARK